MGTDEQATEQVAGTSSFLAREERGFTRRRFLAGVGSVGLGLLMPGCGNPPSAPGGGAEGKTLTISDFGGELSKAYRQAFYDEFERAKGVKIEIAPTVTMGALKAQTAQESPTWDLVENSPYFMIIAGEKGYLEPLDYDAIPNATGSSIQEGARFKYSMSFNSYSDVVSWNTQQIERQPASWSDMWDVQTFPGKRSYISYPEYGALEQPLRAQGVPQTEIYAELRKPDFAGVDRSLQSLEELAPSVSQWWSFGAEPASALANGSVAMAYAWSGRVAPLQSQGAPVSFTYDDGILVLDSLAVVKGSANAKLAHEFINFTLDKRRQAKLAELSTYGPVNEDALKLIAPEKLKLVNTAPTNRDKQMVLDQQWTADNFSAISKRYAAALTQFQS